MCVCVSVCVFFKKRRYDLILWLHHLNSNEIFGRKSRWVRHKDTGCCFWHILEATLYKTTPVRPFTAHKLSRKDEQDMLDTAVGERTSTSMTFSFWFQHMDTPVFAAKQKTYIHHLCVDTECHLDDLPKAITNRDGWSERKKESTTWKWR